MMENRIHFKKVCVAVVVCLSLTIGNASRTGAEEAKPPAEAEEIRRLRRLQRWLRRALFALREGR